MEMHASQMTVRARVRGVFTGSCYGDGSGRVFARGTADCHNGRMSVVDSASAPARGRYVAGYRLVRDLVRRHPWYFATAVSGAAVFAVFTAGSSLGIRWLIDHVIVPRFDEGGVAWGTVFAGCGLIVAISLVRAAGVVVRRTYAGRTQWGIAEDLGVEVVSRYASQPVPWHRRHATGDLISRAGVDVETSTAVLAPLPYGSSVVLLLLVSAVGLWITDPALGVVAVLVIPLLVLSNVVYQRRVDSHFHEAQNELGALSEAVHESFEAVAVVKAFGAEERETERLSAITGRLRDARVRAVRARAGFEMALDLVPSLANLLLLWVGALRVRSGDISVGELASSMYLFTLLVVPLRLIGYVFSELPHSQAGWERVRGILDEPIDADPRDSLRETPAGVAVRLAGVTLVHEGTVVLGDVDFTIDVGVHTALVGATGSGKTSLLRAIAGTMPLESGTVSVARGGTGLVHQEPFIFSESVRFNLALGEDVDDAVLDAALRVADAEFLHGLENGLDTALGERGASLSGGQRQRLALARELVGRPAVLLLDDTTSALDPETELRVLANLRASGMAGTILMVATRPSTIAAASAVLYVADDGSVHQGTHEHLMDALPGYRALLEAFDDDRRGKTDR